MCHSVLTGHSSQYLPEYCPSCVSAHLHSPQTHSPWPEHSLLMCSPYGVMHVSFDARHSHAV